MEASGQSHAPAALLPANNPSSSWNRGSVGPRAGLDVLEKRKSPTWILTAVRPARSLVACTYWANPALFILLSAINC
jgi:hypothetical protein